MIYRDAFSKVNKELGFFRFAEHGLARYATGLVANEDYIKAKPDLLKRFIRATQKGWVYAIENQKESNEILDKYSPENKASIESDLFRIKNDLEYHKDFPETYDKGLGYAAPEKWKTTYDLIVEYLKVKNAPPLDQLYTNEFISNIAPTKK